jgi:DNA repair ATPase RecN
MLRRLAVRDFAIVEALEVEFDAGFSVLTGETGAGKSILVDALQLALGARADAAVVREGSLRADISAEFDSPPSLASWLESGGFEPGESLLVRRVVDAQARSRAWINGCPATLAQLREAADALVDIHGQHAWQSLTRPQCVRSSTRGPGSTPSRSRGRSARGARPSRHWRMAATGSSRSSASASGWPGRSASSTSWHPAPTNGTN